MAQFAKLWKQPKKISKNPPKDPFCHQILFKPNMRVGDYFVSVSKTDRIVKVTKTKVNQVLGLPLTVSTQRVKLTPSKPTLSDEVLMLANSRSEERSQNPIFSREVVLEEHSLYLSRILFLRGMSKMDSPC